jgi:MFS transporter, DHA2 family, multidrug resistance protein
VILASPALFAAGSLACAYSRTPGEFIAARVLLGLAGAGLTVMAVSVLAVLFSKQERPKAVRIWAAANMVAFPAGPILGGWLLSHFWWGWVFLMNVPVAVLGLDVIGIGTSSGGLVALTYGLIEAGQYGWRSPTALAWMLAGLVLLVGFFGWERALVRRGGQPVLDLALFQSAAFTWGAFLIPVLFLALTGLLFTMPQYFQGCWAPAPRGPASGCCRCWAG